ncbi:MAG: glycine--tRNA ligase subunit beta [Deltaproteobacteria bacterium]|nr:glycine--tRNA ligase subunit beta [Deltaproteobacteria bacterium]
MKTLLVEIGAEEIPAGYIQPALQAFAQKLSDQLSRHRVDCGEITTYGTPRRLVVKASAVADRQKSVTIELLGPPERVAFDAKGQPTVAAQKFAEKVGLPMSKLTTAQTPKGKYLCAKKTERGVGATSILKDILADIALSLPFPKTMRWADKNLVFARPIISILAMLDSQVVSFELGGLKSTRMTYGHPIMCPGKIKIDHVDRYADALRDAYVIVDPEARKQKVLQEITASAERVGGRVLEDNDLLDIVTNLVEYPVATVGDFDTDYLALPQEILITAMREHQKYFAVVDETGALMAHFIAVNNTIPKDLDLVTQGHQRVLRARLEDARFFCKTDMEDTLETWVEKLKRVLFQSKLGSVHDKIIRVGKIVQFLAETLSLDADLTQQAVRAARLCKADLVSLAVGEFPKLQGTMGRVYALAQGENPSVAKAIEEHYRPIYSGAPLPETRIGAMLAIADKIDSICGCFKVGLIPTGTADPYALRRQGIGIVQIILDQDFSISLGRLIETGMALFDDLPDAASGASPDQVLSFLKNRITHLLADEGFSKDVIAAVLNTGIDRVSQVRQRVAALEKLKTRPDFEPLAIAFKRVVNIIKKADPSEGPAVDETLFEKPCESALFAGGNRVRESVREALDQGQFEAALQQVATLREEVDDFFEGVMVMADDDKIRNNRLGLLRRTADLFGLLADFSKIST